MAVSLYKRKGSPFWYMCLQDPRLPGGIHRRSTKLRHRREAQAFADEIQESLIRELERQTSGTGLTISQAAEYYFDKGGLAKSTLSNHLSMLSIILKSQLGDFDMGSLSVEDIENFVQERRQTPVRPHNKQSSPSTRTVSDQTIRHYLSMMSKIYGFARAHRLEGAPTKNPFKDYDRSFLGNTPIRDRQLRQTTFQSILDALNNPEHCRILITLVSTGMRASELMTLRIPQVDFLSEDIYLGYEEDEETKTRRARVVPMTAEVKLTLETQIDELKKHPGFVPDGYVFPSRVRGEGGLRSRPRDSLAYINKVVKKIVGISGYTNHRLRHSFASWLLQKDVDPITIKDLLGHRTLSTTIRYAHTISDSRKRKIRELVLVAPAQTNTQSIRFSERKIKKSKLIKEVKKQ